MGGHRHPGENSRPILARGLLGPDVRDLQARLKVLRFYRGAVDGAFGPLTQGAVIRFQRSRGLAPDGIVGAKVWTALGS